MVYGHVIRIAVCIDKTHIVCQIDGVHVHSKEQNQRKGFHPDKLGMLEILSHNQGDENSDTDGKEGHLLAVFALFSHGVAHHAGQDPEQKNRQEQAAEEHPHAILHRNAETEGGKRVQGHSDREIADAQQLHLISIDAKLIFHGCLLQISRRPKCRAA